MGRGLLLDNGQRTTDYRQRTSPRAGRSFSLDNRQRTTDGGLRTTEGGYGLRTTADWEAWYTYATVFLFIDNYKKKDKI
jgi:hypothetical protein